MKRVLLFLSVLAVAAFGFSGVASAGTNCILNEPATATSGSGYPGTTIYFGASVHGCTQTEAVRFLRYNGGYPTGWLDFACSCFGQGDLQGTSASSVDVNVTGPGTFGIVVTQVCWWYGATRSVSAQYWVQLKNSVTHTWGSAVLKNRQPPYDNIFC